MPIFEIGTRHWVPELFLQLLHLSAVNTFFQSAATSKTVATCCSRCNDFVCYLTDLLTSCSGVTLAIVSVCARSSTPIASCICHSFARVPHQLQHAEVAVSSRTHHETLRRWSADAAQILHSPLPDIRYASAQISRSTTVRVLQLIERQPSERKSKWPWLQSPRRTSPAETADGNSGNHSPLGADSSQLYQPILACDGCFFPGG